MKFTNTQVFNFPGAIRGMRNPMNSWFVSDSNFSSSFPAEPILGPKDLGLATNLVSAGPEHRKFLRQIIVSVDIEAPRYWWQEFDAYKVGITSNSCSTMHRLQAYEFTIDMFETEFNPKEPPNGNDEFFWTVLLNYLNDLRREFLETKDMKVFRKMKQALPESYIQRRTITFNYEVILNMFLQRENHRLKEWSRDFVGWALRLPYMKEFIDAAKGKREG